MSKKWTIVLVVVVAVLAILYFGPRNSTWELLFEFNKNDSNTSIPETSAAPGTGNSVQGTGTVTYKCAQNQSFSLAFSDADTARLSGSGLTSTTLSKTGIDYWLSADGKTVVKPAGGYIVLVQNDKTIRDLCAK